MHSVIKGGNGSERGITGPAVRFGGLLGVGRRDMRPPPRSLLAKWLSTAAPSSVMEGGAVYCSQNAPLPKDAAGGRLPTGGLPSTPTGLTWGLCVRRMESAGPPPHPPPYPGRRAIYTTHEMLFRAVTPLRA